MMKLFDLKEKGLALAEGALPSHLLIAMFTVSTDSRILSNGFG